MPDIDMLQHAIIKEFSTLDQEPELLLDHLIDLGTTLPPLETRYKTPKYLIPGCLSHVWLLQEEQAGHLQLRADSNAAITKGLVSLLVRIFSNQPIKDIADAKLFFVEHLPLQHLLGIQRRSGFEYMVQHIRSYAREFTKRTSMFTEK